MNPVLEFVLALVPIFLVIGLVFVAWNVVTGLHQLHNAKIAPQPPAYLAELRMSGRSKLGAGAFGFVLLIIFAAVYLYGPALVDWFAAG